MLISTFGRRSASGRRHVALSAWALAAAGLLGPDAAFALEDEETQAATPGSVTPGPVTPSPGTQADANIVPYAPAFFAEFRPVTALDMIGRIPGFQFDRGASARGLAGTAGNVLIDGDRPPTRSDSLDSVLGRIPASQVLRIDIVRNGAGGIDMQGKSVVANVIRKPDGGISGAVTAGLNLNDNADLSPNLYVEARRQWEGRLLEGSLQLYHGPGSQQGSRVRTAPNGDVLLRALSRGEYLFDEGEATGVYEGPLAGGRIRANGLVSYNTGDFDFRDLLAVPLGQEHSISTNEQWKGEIGLCWTRSLPAGATLELVGSQQIVHGTDDGSYDTPDFTSLTRSMTDTGESVVNGSVKLAPVTTPIGVWTIETGSEMALNWVENGTAYQFDGSPLLLPGDDTRVEELRSETFVTGVWAARPNLSVETTLRFEASRITATGSGGEAETNLAFVKPRLNIGWTPRPGHQLSFKLERNAEQLSFGAFQAEASFSTGVFGRGNPDIRPAQIWLAQGRYERVYDRLGSFVAEATHEQIDDVLGSVVITETPPGGTTPVSFTITRNVGSATRDTLKLTNKLPLDRYGWVGGIFTTQVTFRQSQTQDPVTFDDRRLNGEQPFGWSLSLSRNLIAQRISWSVGAQSGSDTRSFGARTLSRYRSDPYVYGSISYRPDDTLSLSANLSLSPSSENRFRLFDGPRGTGRPIFDEINTNDGRIQASLSLRRSF